MFAVIPVNAGLKYIDRGDFTAPDFTMGDFTIDNTLHTLDLPAYIPSNAKGVLIQMVAKATVEDKRFSVYPYPYVNLEWYMFIKTWNANSDVSCHVFLPLIDGNKINYKIAVGM
ncbi:unnamed protein product, partial [marine sediment metagenome]